ncbi:ankyrin repeat-containing domain protein [Phyllosticta citricarpa]|uniref:Ankyrin repeat-containing domain protein n=1 Tax=Phyllosticta citricarpa TaxID=55181 RepID=A0ABR1MBQ9_9PEZI
MASLWDQSIAKLSADEQRMFRCGSASQKEILNEIVAKVEKQQDRCLRRRWIAKDFKGRDIVIRDVCAKLISSVKSFLLVVDIAVQYDPTHAALPWAGIRFLLQLCVNSTEAFDAMIEGLEKASDVIARCTIMESLYLPAVSDAQKSFENQLSKVYGGLLNYLCEAMRYYKKSFIRRFLADTTRRQVLEDALKSISEGDLKVKYQRELIDAERTLATLTIAESNKGLFGTMSVKVDEVQAMQKALQQALKDLEAPFIRMESQVGQLHSALEASERSGLLKWLSALDFHEHHKAMLSGILPQTGEWLFANPEYTSWKSSSSSEILWLHGTWGCGKSRLAAVIIEDFKRQRASVPQAAPIAYFYCRRDTAEPQRADCEEILRAIVKQLSVSNGQITGVTIDKYKSKVEDGKKMGLDASPLTKDQSVELILQLTAATPATILIDGLDECGSQQRGAIMLAFKEIIAKSRDLVKVVVCSREEDDIKNRLGHARDISVTSRQNGKDLSRFINLKVKDFIIEWGQKPGKKPDELAELEKDIVCALENGAQGMFLWVTLQLEAIRDTEQIVFDEDIRDALTHLPAGLKKSFDAVRGRITSMEKTAQSVALLVLKWLLCAQRTLSVQELVAAVSGGIRGKRQFSAAEILSCCCGLVVLDSELDEFRLSHLSVREYLEPLQEFGSVETHSTVATRCLSACICRDPSQDVLIDYSTIYWPAHCEAVGVSNRDAALKAVLLKFFTEEEHFEDWQESLADRLKSQDVCWHGDLIKKLNAVPSSPPSPLFAICCFGLSEVLEHLTASGLLQDLEHFNKHNANGLYLAAHFGYEVIVKILIGRGCDVSAVCGRFGSAVKAAAFFGHCSIVQLLLEHHAATESGPGDFSNPLQAALAGGHEDIVEVLLRSDFKFSTKDEFDEALQFAAFKGHARLVEHLLQGKLGDYVPSESHDPLQVALHGCMERESKRQLQGYPDINAEVGYFGNALQAAIIGGKLSLVQLVHKAGASLNSRGRFGFPIRAAAIASRDDILLWLLDQGADPNIQDDELGDALQAAASKAHLSTMSILLEHGANTRGYGGYFKNCMQAAAYAGHDQAVKLLLENKAAIHERGRFTSTLQAAIHARHDDIVDLLLQNGARVNEVKKRFAQLCGSKSQKERRALPKVHDGSGQVDIPNAVNSLELAARYGDVQLIQKLISHGANVDAEDIDTYFDKFDSGSTYTALQIAAFWGHRDAVVCLLENGANIKAERQTLGTPLQAALEGARLDIALLLLERGAPIDQHWNKFGSCLQIFCERDNLEVVRFVLENGANIEDTGGKNGNALQVASYTGRIGIVQFLLESGASIEAPGKRNGNALQAAAGGGHLQVVQLLVRNGANVNSPGGKRGTALQVASAKGHLEVVTYLLDQGAKMDTADGGLGSSLHLASYFGHTEIVQVLLERGADIHSLHDLPDERHKPHRLCYYRGRDQKRNALFAACKQGNTTTARLLFCKDPWSYVDRETFDCVAEECAESDHYEISSMLISEGARVGLNAHVFSNMISTSLRRRRLPFLESIIQNFPDIDDLGSIGPSILQEAAYHGDAATVASLLDKGIGTAFCDQALISAASVQFDSEFEQTGNRYIPPAEAEKIWLDGMLEVIRILVEAGAEVKPLKEMEHSFASQIFQHGTLQFFELLDRRGLTMVPHGDSLEFQEILQKASNVGNLDAVKYLVQKAHKADHTGHPSYAPALKSAVSGGQKNVVEFLLDLTLSGDIFNVVDDNPLLEATRVKDLETTQLLLREIDHNPLVIQAALEIMFKDEDMYSYGWCSTSSEEPEKQTRRLQSLLQSLSFKTDVSPLCTRFLSDARASLKEGPLGLLLAHGANPNAKSAEGSTQLYQASQNNCADQVKILLESGANPNLEGGEFGTPLHAAARKGALDVVDLLVKAGADVNHRFGHYGYPLTAAMTGSGYVERYLLRGKDIRIAELLVENGADVDAQGGFYGSAVQAATSVGNEQGVKVLLKMGANPSLKGGNYGSALKASRHMCTDDCHHAAFEGIWKYGSDIETKYRERITQLLLDAGASDSE